MPSFTLFSYAFFTLAIVPWVQRLATKYIFSKAHSSRPDSRKPRRIPFTQLDTFKCIDYSAGCFYSLTQQWALTIISTIATKRAQPVFAKKLDCKLRSWWKSYFKRKKNSLKTQGLWKSSVNHQYWSFEEILHVTKR